QSNGAVAVAMLQKDTIRRRHKALAAFLGHTFIRARSIFHLTASFRQAAKIFLPSSSRQALMG
ncbi:hypothetical protein, partial [Thalassobaculum salexigens]|uniref:hypothetical protein n=1 Tax=Thalassobaculum salexigens TaxID=455360 RepID=UPI00248EF1B1